MNGFGAMVIREIGERKRILAAALVAGLVPLLDPLLPGSPGWSAGPDRPIALAIFISLAFALVMSTMLGASIIGRDLGEGRLGFYFSRPLSVGALWGGKIIGAMLLIATAALLVLLPTFVVSSGHSIWRDAFGGHIPLVVCALLLLLFFLSHAMGVVLRARNAWIVLPLVSAGIGGLLTWNAVRPLIFLYIGVPAVAWLMVGLVTLSLMAGGYLQLRQARTDVVVGARILAISTAVGLLAAALLLSGFSSWVRASTPADLRLITSVLACGEGDWVAVSGPVSRAGVNYRTTFLLDTVHGRWVGVDDSLTGYDRVSASADGRRAIWSRFTMQNREPFYQLFMVPLDAENPEAEYTGITLSGRLAAQALSNDGSRVAAVNNGVLSVHELATGKLLAAKRLPVRHGTRWMFFRGPDTVRIYWRQGLGEPSDDGGGILSIGELSVGEGNFSRTGEIQDVWSGGMWNAGYCATGDRILINVEEAGERGNPLLLCDARTGERISLLQLDGGTPLPLSKGVFLADGRIAANHSSGDRQELFFFSPDGLFQHRLEVAVGSHLIFGGQISSGGLVVATTPHGSRKGSMSSYFSDLNTCYLVDPDNGAVELLGENLHPAMIRLNWGWYGYGLPSSPGSPATSLFLHHGQLLEIDPESGDRRTILPFG